MLQVLLHFMKRFLSITCYFFRAPLRLFRRKSCSHILPLTMENTNSEEWDSWNFHTKSKPRSMVDSQIEHYRQKLKVDALKQAEPTQEVDYFQDIAPECKGNKKIIVRKKEDNTNIVEPRRDLFTVKQDVDIRVNRGVELGELDDTEAPTTNFDHSWDVDEENIDIDGTLKEIKNRERQERLQKHQQRNTEKLSQRAI